jgi:hypothetical protein
MTPAHTKDRDRAFHDTALALFKQHPIQLQDVVENDSFRAHKRRDFLNDAALGYHRKGHLIPYGTLAVPDDELLAIHTLIYG